MSTSPDSPDSYDENSPDAAELLDFELIAKSHQDKSHGLWLWVVLVLILAGGGWAGWMYLQNGGGEMANTGRVPIILAPKFAVKEKPTDPGGMVVRDRDKLVYDRMAGQQNTGGVPGSVPGGAERLLPPPQAPVEPPQSAPTSLQPSSQGEKPGPKAPLSAVPKTPPPKVVDQPKVAPKAVVKSVSKDPDPVQKAPINSGVKATGRAGKGYLVQLSAVRNEANAKTEWARLVKKYPSVLGGLKLVIQRADLGTKGVFYRVRGGWFANRAEAKAVCDELAKRNVGCLLAKP